MIADFIYYLVMLIFCFPPILLLIALSKSEFQETQKVLLEKMLGSDSSTEKDTITNVEYTIR